MNAMDEGVYVDHIHHPCATNGILIGHVGCNLFLVANTVTN
jgi:hypothetical protein